MRKLVKFLWAAMIVILMANQTAFAFELSYTEFTASADQTLTTDTEKISPAPESLVAILAHESVLADNELTDQIQLYAKDIQNALPRTKAKLIRVASTDSVQEVIDVLDRLYFDGEEGRHLRGLVIIGPVPLPRVMRNDETFVSIWPYVDMEEKAYEWSEEKHAYVRAPHMMIPRAELWHGVITPPRQGDEGIKMLKQYFEKNHAFHADPEKFALLNGDKKILVADLKYESKNLNRLNFGRYEGFLKHLEDFAYHRFSKKWLKNLQKGVIEDLKQTLQGQEGSSEIKTMLKNDDTQMNQMPDIQTKFLIEQLLVPYVKLFSKYLADVNDWVTSSGRYTTDDVDTIPSLLSTRDLETRERLKNINDRIEQKIDAIVLAKAEKIPLIKNMTVTFQSHFNPLFKTVFSNRGTNGFINGFPIEKMETIEQCSLLRGTVVPEIGSDNFSEQAAVLLRTADPSNVKMCKKDLPENMSCDPLTNPSLGIYARTLTSQEALDATYNVETNSSFSYGAIIEDDLERGRLGLEPWGSAYCTYPPHESGLTLQKCDADNPILQYGDIIVSVNGKPLTPDTTLDDILDAIGGIEMAPVKIIYVRKNPDGTTLTGTLDTRLQPGAQMSKLNQYDTVNECHFGNFTNPLECQTDKAEIPIFNPAGSYPAFSQGALPGERIIFKTPDAKKTFLIPRAQDAFACYEFQENNEPFFSDVSFGLQMTFATFLEQYGFLDGKDNNGDWYDTNDNEKQDKMQWVDRNGDGKVQLMLPTEDIGFQLQTVPKGFVYDGAAQPLQEFVGGDWGVDDPYEDDPAFAYPKNSKGGLYDNTYLEREFLANPSTQTFTSTKWLDLGPEQGMVPAFTITFAPELHDKKLSAVFQHNEPKAKTLDMQFRAGMSSTLPIDLPRRVAFLKKDADFRRDAMTDMLYPNIFTSDSVTEFLETLKTKEQELSDALQENVDGLLTTEIQGEEWKTIEESLQWKSLTVNQKHELLLKTLNSPKQPYELLYFVADGDHKSFGFDFQGTSGATEFISTALPLTSGATALEQLAPPDQTEPMSEEKNQAFGLALNFGAEIDLPTFNIANIGAWWKAMEEWLEGIKKFGKEKTVEVDLDDSPDTYESALTSEEPTEKIEISADTLIMKPGATNIIRMTTEDQNGNLITGRAQMFTVSIEGPVDKEFLESQDFDTETPGIQIGAYDTAELELIAAATGEITVKAMLEEETAIESDTLTMTATDDLFLAFSSSATVLVADGTSQATVIATVTDQAGTTVPYKSSLTWEISDPSAAHFASSPPAELINGHAETKIVSTGKFGKFSVSVEVPGIGIGTIFFTTIPSKVPVFAKVKGASIMQGEDLKEAANQVLLASLLGSDFGDATKEDYLAGHLVMHGKTQATFALTQKPTTGDSAHLQGFGFNGNNKHMLLLSGGTMIGEATLAYLPETGIVIGDPTAKLSIPKSNISATGFTSALEQEIWTGPEPITEIVTMDIDNDERTDILAAYESGKVRLLSNENSAKKFHDRGNLLDIQNGIRSMVSADFDHDNDADLAIATRDPCTKDEACLDLYLNHGGFFVRKNLKLAFANRIHQLEATDMNNDGWTDLITADTGGNIKIFLNSENGFDNVGIFLGQFAIDGDNEKKLAKIDIVVGTNFSDVPIVDGYPDVLARPHENPLGAVTYFYSAGKPNVYQTLTVTPESKKEKPEKIVSEIDLEKLQSGLQSFLKSTDSDQDGLPDQFDDTPTTLENIESAVKETVSNLRCSGGCLKLPINEAFFVPSNIGGSSPNFYAGVQGTPTALPVFGIGPDLPFVYPGVPKDTTFFRFYISPTLTGQLGFGICTGQDLLGTCYAWNGPSFIPKNFCDAMDTEISEAIGTSSGDMSVSGSGYTTIVANGSNTATPLPPNEESGNGLKMKLPGSTQTFPITLNAKTNIRVPGFPGMITDWLDAQIEEILNKIGDMPDLYFIYPRLTSIVGAFVPQKKFRSFTELLTYINSIPLLQIQGKDVMLKIPFLTKQQVRKIQLDHERWLSDFDTELQRFKKFLSCGEALSSPYADICAKVEMDATKLKKRVEENVKNLKAWENFPKQILNYKTYEAKLARQLINYLDTITGYLGGYLARQQKIVEQWMKFIAQVKNMVLDWQVLVDIMAQYVASCDSCKSDRGSMLEFLLRLFISIPETPPVIPFPKLPDFVVDMSQIEIGAKVIWPDLKFRPEPLIVPLLPRIQLPTIPGVLVKLPPLEGFPEIVKPPPLPNLPELPKISLPKLPDLPPAPKFTTAPKLDANIKTALEGLKNITKIACLIKTGAVPVPETALKTEIEALTARPLNPIQPIDITGAYTGGPFPFGIDGIEELELPEQVRVNGKLDLELKTTAIYDEMKKFADEVMNAYSTDLVKAVNETLKQKFKEGSPAKAGSPPIKLPEKIEFDFSKKESFVPLGRMPEFRKRLAKYANRQEAFRDEYSFSRLVAETGDFVPWVSLTPAENDFMNAVSSSDPYSALSEQVTETSGAAGILITNPATGLTEKLIAFTGELDGINRIRFADLDQDGDEDALFSLNGNLYLKENHLKIPDEDHIGSGIKAPVALNTLLPHARSLEILSTSYASAKEAETFWKASMMPNLKGYEITARGAIGTVTKNILLNDLPNPASPSATMALGSGNYYTTIQAYDDAGNRSTISRTILLAPQDCADHDAPLVKLKSTTVKVPILQSAEIDVTSSIDQAGAVVNFGLDMDLAADSNFDGDPTNDKNVQSKNPVFTVGPFTETGAFGASVIVEDQSGNTASAPVTIDVYAPKVILQSVSAVSGFARGGTFPQTPQAPITIVRERKGAVNVIAETETDGNGDFNAENLDIISKTVIKNSEGTIVAAYNPKTETIDILEDGYTVEFAPAEGNLPARWIVKNPAGTALASLVIVLPIGKNFLGTEEKPKIVDASFFMGEKKKITTEKITTVTTQPFDDVSPNTPQYEAIAELQKKGIVSGYTENGKTLFKPNQLLNRAEYVKIVLEMLCISPSEAAKSPPPVFTDIPYQKPPPWHYEYAKEGFLQNLIIGYTNEKDPVTGFTPFKSQKTISRAEAVMILLRALKLVHVAEIDEKLKGTPWYAPFMKLAQDLSGVLVKQTEGGKAFIVTSDEAKSPEELMTRGEFAEMASRVFQFHDCFAIDSDNGGVSDVKEKQMGKNPLDPKDDFTSIKITEEVTEEIEKIAVEGPPIGVYLIKEPCTTCPCTATIADSAQILPGDTIYAVIANPQKTEIYAKSNSLSP